jgi:hypothetical protein
MNYYCGLLGLTIASKLLVFLVFWVGMPQGNGNVQPIDAFFSGGVIQVLEQFGRLYTNHDSGWYMHIAQNGYDQVDISKIDYSTEPWTKQTNHPFFPGLPYGLRLASAATGLSLLATLPIYTFLLTFGCLCFAYLFFRATLKSTFQVKLALFLLVFLPFNIHLQMFYTEALFLGALFAALWAILKQRWLVLFLSCLILSLTRPNGSLLRFVLLAFYFESHLRYASDLRNPRHLLAQHWPILTLGGLVIGLGWQMYTLYLATGDPLAFKTVQVAWGRTGFQNPFNVLHHLVDGDWVMKLLSGMVIVYILLGLVLIVKQYPLSAQILYWSTLLLPLATGTPHSIVRYMVIAIPIYVLLSDILQRKHSITIASCCLLCLAGYCWYTYQWLLGSAVTY